MKEVKPGIYTGEYLVLPGDNIKDMPIVATLKNPLDMKASGLM